MSLGNRAGGLFLAVALECDRGGGGGVFAAMATLFVGWYNRGGRVIGGRGAGLGIFKHIFSSVRCPVSVVPTWAFCILGLFSFDREFEQLY